MGDTMTAEEHRWKYREQELLAELRTICWLLENRRKDLARCPHHPKGERCALPAGHEGPCKWDRGD